MSRTGDLFVLQDIDTRTEHDQARLATAVATIAGDPELERLRTALSRVRRQRARSDAEVEAQSAAVDELRRRTAALDRRLYGGSVHNPQELLSMQNDVAALTARADAEDDRLLTLMEQSETVAGSERDAAAAVAEREAQRAAGAGVVAAEVDSLRASLDAHAVDRAALLDSLPAPDLALYERLRRRVRPAVVRLTGDACGGCHLPLANSEVRAVRGGDALVQCSGCDRIVVS